MSVHVRERTPGRSTELVEVTVVSLLTPLIEDSNIVTDSKPNNHPFSVSHCLSPANNITSNRNMLANKAHYSGAPSYCDC